MTDNEIIKALECFAIDKDFDETHCIGCAFEHQFCTANMSEDIAIPALALINRQKAEIDRLQNDLAQTEDAYKTVHEMNGAYAIKIDFAKAEAIKEFAAKIKEDAEWICDDSYIEDALTEYIDNLVKEMVGDDNNSPIVDKQN